MVAAAGMILICEKSPGLCGVDIKIIYCCPAFARLIAIGFAEKNGG
jgi:hypothetical protein